ncbi:unnamed protein product [Cuscuta campestris]|uniref:Protein NUCLEAR FUSION DEFECTIVE 6, chloroplastic/mitochondrial-like n=1 Tax=Cuscuta campestris TaxID=132261 RepID=A0A484MHT3_9ASTE|nr:unnamed protein product [Cuscuta campestris]
MASAAAARSFFRSSSSVLNAAGRFTREAKAARAPCRMTYRSPLGSRFFRRPVELSGCGISMQPFHTATALALMNSMLAVSPHSFSWLSEGV